MGAKMGFNGGFHSKYFTVKVRDNVGVKSQTVKKLLTEDCMPLYFPIDSFQRRVGRHPQLLGQFYGDLFPGPRLLGSRFCN